LSSLNVVIIEVGCSLFQTLAKNSKIRLSLILKVTIAIEFTIFFKKVSSNHSYIAAFDLDKTILSVNSSRLVVTRSRKLGLMTRRDYHRAIYYSLVYKFDLKDANEIVLSMMKWLKGLKEAEVVTLSERHIVPEMKKTIRPEIVEEIKYHRRNNARLVMLSSALPYLCNPIARHLGMDDVVCTNLEKDNDSFTGRSIGPLVFGPEKAVRMNKYCTENSCSMEDAWYYGDAYTDRFVLGNVGHPVCVQPEMKLRWLAKRKGWKII
jgi:HAD superfamily hydrolase (TIGR01490 family)